MNIMGNTSMIRNVAMENSNGQVEILTKANTKMTKETVTGKCFGQMEVDI